MNFFSAQDDARRRTGRLVALFMVAVLMIGLAVYTAVSLGFFIYDLFEHPHESLFSWWSLPRFVITLTASFLVILCGSLYKQMELRRGGHVVVRMLGGYSVDASTQDPLHRRLRNIVEEMAIASGVPVPEVFVLEHEYGINALAAGFTLNDAAIAVTQGTLQALDRDELQGVIAHEFSHILNGDMRLNTQLMGWLHGILMLTILGRILREPWGGDSYAGGRGYIGPRMRGGGSRGSGGSGAGAAILAIIVVAVFVTVIGYVGAFVSRRIKQAILRQREYLADAAAVQFTRNPAGIGGALLKVGGLRNGSHIMSAHAEEVSHFFLSNPMWSAKPRASGTHPPLPERIRRIDPRWDGTFPEVERPGPHPQDPTQSTIKGTQVSDPLLRGVITATMASSIHPPASPSSLPELVADSGRVALERLPEAVKNAAHQSQTARELLLSLLLHKEQAIYSVQLEAIANNHIEVDAQQVAELQAATIELDEDSRLALVDILLPTLKHHLSLTEYQGLSQLIDQLIRSDHRTSAFEFLLRRKFHQNVGPTVADGQIDQGQIDSKRIDQIAPQASLLLSLIARQSTPDLAEAKAKFNAAITRSYVLNGYLTFDPTETIDFEHADEALDNLSHATFALRRHLIEAAGHCTILGDAPTPEELNLLRMFSQALGCPLPR